MFFIYSYFLPLCFSLPRCKYVNFFWVKMFRCTLSQTWVGVFFQMKKSFLPYCRDFFSRAGKEAEKIFHFLTNSQIIQWTLIESERMSTELAWESSSIFKESYQKLRVKVGPENSILIPKKSNCPSKFDWTINSKIKRIFELTLTQRLWGFRLYTSSWRICDDS